MRGRLALGNLRVERRNQRGAGGGIGRRLKPDSLTDCIVLERLSPIGRELIPVLYEKNYLGTAVINFDVIKIYPNSSILPKYFCLDTPQNKALSLNQ